MVLAIGWGGNRVFGAMDNLAVIFRAGQLLAHQLHNEVSGVSFFADHEFLGGLYGEYEEGYDAIVERVIGLGLEKVDIAGWNKRAVKVYGDMAGDKAFDAKKWPRYVLEVEKAIQAEIRDYLKKGECSDGVQNLLQGMADESEARSYKIGQRLK